MPDSTKLFQAYNIDSFRQQGHRLIDQLADYLESTIESPDAQKVLDWIDPDDQVAWWEKALVEGRTDIDAFFAELLQRSIHVHHPKYMGHQISPTLPIAALAGMVGDLLNNGMGIYEMGSASTAVERVVVQTVCQAIGYDEQAGGVMTSGGSLANLTALLAARSLKASSDVWSEGSHKQLALMVSDEAHYCVERAVRIMGWGATGIIKIPTDDQYRMKTHLLEKYYLKAQEEGVEVIAVVGSACTTSTGSFDDLVAIADFCERHNIWMHVDGAHGGATVFSQKYKPLVKGIERADSVVMDFHKTLMTPSITTALLYKNEQASYSTFATKAQYLWQDAVEPEWYNLAKRTFECTKLMIGVKAYSIIRTHGVSLFDDYVSTCYDLGKTFAQAIEMDASFELATSPECNIVCFRLFDEGLEEEALNDLNRQVRQAILEEGNFYIVQTVVRNKLFLRVTLTNPFTTEKEIKDLLSRLKFHAKCLTNPLTANQS